MDNRCAAFRCGIAELHGQANDSHHEASHAD